MINKGQPLLFEEIQSGTDNPRPGKRKSPAGKATNELVFSALVGENADLFPTILQLYVPKRSVIADVTYGQGVFWRQINRKEYTLKTSDLKDDALVKSAFYQTG